MKKGSKNDLKIDAKIIKTRDWTAKGRPDVDFDYFLGGLGTMSKMLNFWIGQKSTKNRKVCKNWKIGTRGACRPGIAWGRKARRVFHVVRVLVRMLYVSCVATDVYGFENAFKEFVKHVQSSASYCNTQIGRNTFRTKHNVATQEQTSRKTM